MEEETNHRQDEKQIFHMTSDIRCLIEIIYELITIAWLITHCGINLPQKSARSTSQKSGIYVSALLRQHFPVFKRDRVWNPRVSPVDIVLDQDKTTSRAQVIED